MIEYQNVTMCPVCVYVDWSMSIHKMEKRIRQVTEKAVNVYYDRKGKVMLHLYEVIVWDQETAEARARELVQATSKDNASFAILRKVLKEDEQPDDLDVFVGVIGPLKEKE